MLPTCRPPVTTDVCWTGARRPSSRQARRHRRFKAAPALQRRGISDNRPRCRARGVVSELVARAARAREAVAGLQLRLRRVRVEPPGPLPCIADRITEELRTLLARAGVPPPFVFVGHSFGGFIGLIFARRFRADTAGVALVDPAHAEDWVTPAAKEQLQIDCGVRRCRYGALTARIGLARIVATLVGLARSGPRACWSKVASRRGLSRAGRGDPRRSENCRGSCGRPWRSSGRSPTSSKPSAARSTQSVSAPGRCCRRPRADMGISPHHHLVDRSWGVPTTPAGRDGRPLNPRASPHRVAERPLDPARSARGGDRRDQRSGRRDAGVS